jgi:hypothetical protein
MPFHPNPSFHIIPWGLAFFIMSCHPVSPTILITRDPDSFPCSRNPFSSGLPMTGDIFRRRRGVSGFWRRISHLRGMGKLIDYCS